MSNRHGNTQLEPLTPCPQPQVVSLEAKPVEPRSQPSVFDTLAFIASYTESKTDNIFKNLTNAALPPHSPDFSSSKNAESFCGRNPVNEHDFLNDIPAALASVGTTSPLNIFSAIKSESSPTVLPDPKQIKAPFNSGIKRKENCQNQQEKHTHQGMNGKSHKTCSWF